MKTLLACMHHPMSHVLRDIEMFRTFDGQTQESLFSRVLDRTVLHGGRAYLAALLRRPIHDVVRLRARQRGMLKISSCVTDAELRTLRRYENDVRWFVRQRRADVAHPCFLQSPWLSFVNRHAPTLGLYNFQRIAVMPAVNVLSPLVCVVIPYLMLRYRYGVTMPLLAYMRLLWKALMYGLQSNVYGGGVSVLLSVVFYFQNASSAWELSTTLRRAIRTLDRRMHGVCAFVTAAQRVQAKAWGSCQSWFSAAYEAGSCDVASTATGTLCDYYSMDIDAIELLADRMCMVDAVAAVAKARRAVGMCLPSWDAAPDRKTFVLRGFWHPSLSQTKAVKNDIDLTCAGVLLTGANACGKSTVLKAVLANAWLSHTLGVCCAKDAVLAPLHRIESHIHVPDRAGKASLFEAELSRCSEILERATVTGRSLVVIDELFASTNPVEGVAAAYAAAEALGRMPGVSTIVSTHFTYLSTLERTGSYVNMCMTADLQQEQNRIVYDYVLRRGVSRQYIALEVAAAKGALDPAIVMRAIETRKKITASHVRP